MTLRRLVEEDDNSPYGSITDRQPLQDLSPEGRAQDMFEGSAPMSSAPSAPMNPVKEAIKAKMAGKAGTDYLNDPLMQDYNKREQELKDFRQAKLGADLNTNIAQAFSQAARGTAAPVSNDALYANEGKQSESLAKSGEEDLDRRQKIVNAIEQRKSREAMALEGAKNRSLQRDQMTQIRGDRLLSGLGTHFENDPILKPAQVNLESLNKSNKILTDRSIPLSAQSLADAEQDVASALSLRPNMLSEGKIKRTEIDDLHRKIGELKQKWGSKIVDMRTEAPEIVAQLQGLNNILRTDYVSTINGRYKNLIGKQKKLIGDPALQGRLDEYLATALIPGEESKASAIANNSGSAVPNEASSGVGLPGMSSAQAGSGGKTIVKKQYSPSRNQTKIIYEDGNEDVVNGKL